MGYDTHADFALECHMAKTLKAVYDFLHRLWQPALKRAKTEAEALQQMIDAEGGTFQLAAWDGWYYAEKVKKEKYALDEEMLRPYFSMENVIDGAFAVAHHLYGIHFIRRHDIQVYHPDVRVYEVQESDGRHIIDDRNERDVIGFEKASLDKIGLIPQIVSRYQTTNFQHIIGGYSAGYYSYIWAVVLDADAFEAFKENGIFDKPTAAAFRAHILAKGGGVIDPMESYKTFSGREPKVDALLKRRRLN